MFFFHTFPQVIVGIAPLNVGIESVKITWFFFKRYFYSWWPKEGYLFPSPISLKGYNPESTIWTNGFVQHRLFFYIKLKYSFLGNFSSIKSFNKCSILLAVLSTSCLSTFDYYYLSSIVVIFSFSNSFSLFLNHLYLLKLSLAFPGFPWWHFQPWLFYSFLFLNYLLLL